MGRCPRAGHWPAGEPITARRWYIFGDAPSIAARVQAAAEPGTVVITDATHRRLAGIFEAEERGPQKLKGVAHPQRLYLLKQLRAEQNIHLKRTEYTPQE
jgi:class 3 adenylate cyclase